MAFADSFTQCMSEAGVSVNASVTDEDYFIQSIEYLQEWYNGLPSDTQEALDAATTNDRASYLLAEANVAPGIADLLDDFDNATGWPLSTLVQWCKHCADQSKQGATPAQ